MSYMSRCSFRLGIDFVKSIADRFDALKDAALDLASCGVGDPPHFKHRRTLMMLCANDLGADGAALADTLVEQATQNWEVGRERYGASPSRQNWRFAQVGKMVAHNRSPEVSFERALAEVGGDHWANQVPTCSGLVGYRADGRRSIDLVERVWDRSFNLIELKIGSDTPLFAALEVLDYGVLYAFTRMNARSLGMRPPVPETILEKPQITGPD